MQFRNFAGAFINLGQVVGKITRRFENSKILPSIPHFHLVHCADSTGRRQSCAPVPRTREGSMPTEAQPVYNKDEAERVRDIGISTLHKGDTNKAIWWFTKSKKLYHLDGIDEWIDKATKQMNGDGGGVASSQEVPPPSQPIKETPVEVTASYTEEQLAIVNRIIGFVDYYDKLSLAYTVTEVEEIRKQYRQLSKQVHPDKNKAPRAQQAFQELTQAADCLSDPISRHKYNITRLSRPSTRSNPAQPQHAHTNRPSPAKPPPSQNTRTNNPYSQQHGTYTAPIVYWEPNTSKSPNQARAKDTTTKCPSCSLNCQMNPAINEVFVNEKLIAVCYACRNPFSQVICPHCKANKPFKLRFPKPTAAQYAYNTEFHRQHLKREQQRQQEQAEMYRKMQEEMLREQREGNERMREQMRQAAEEEKRRKREREEEARKEHERKQREKEEEQKRREQYLEQLRREQERERDDREERTKRRTERITKIQEETLKRQEEAIRVREEKEREIQRQKELHQRVEAEKRRQEEERMRRVQQETMKERMRVMEERKRKEREEHEEREEHAERLRKLHQLRREFEQYKEQEIKEEQEEQMKQESDQTRARKEEERREQVRQAELMVRRDQLLKERLAERLSDQARLREQQSSTPPSQASQASPTLKSSIYGKRKDYSSSPIKAEDSSTPNSAKRKKENQDPNPDDDFEEIRPNSKRMKQSPKNVKKQKQQHPDSATAKTEPFQTTPESARVKVKTEKVKTENYPKTPTQTTPDFAARVKTEAKTPPITPPKMVNRKKDLPVQKNSMFRYIVKGAK